MATYAELMDAARRAGAAGDAPAAKRFLELAGQESQARPPSLEAAPVHGPWEKYGSRSKAHGPWEKYQAKKPSTDWTPPPMPEGMAYNPATGQVEDLRSPINPHVPTGVAAAAGIGTDQGVGYGTLDEAVGGLGAATSGADEGAFMRDVMREAERRAQADHPIPYYAGLVGGGILGALGAGKAASYLATKAGVTSAPSVAAVSDYLANAGPVSRAAITSGAAGAADGALYGFGAGEGGFGNRLKTSGETALVGGATGALVPPVAYGAGRLGKAVANVARAPFAKGPAHLAGAKAVQKSLARSGMTPDQVDQIILKAAMEGQPEYTIADATAPHGQGILNAMYRQPGPARESVGDFLVNRQAGQGERIGQFLADALQAPDTAAQYTAVTKAARDDLANKAFDKARAEAAPVDVRGVLKVIDDTTKPLEGVNIAPSKIDTRLKKFRKRLASPTPATDRLPGETAVSQGPTHGGKTAIELSDFEHVYRVRQDVADEIEAARKSGKGNLAKELGKLRTALDAALSDASPSYAQAMQNFRTASDQLRAVDAGTTAAGSRYRAADALNLHSALSPDEQAAFRIGYADPLIAKIENSAPGVNKARALTSDKAREVLHGIATDPELLARRIERENTMFRTSSKALGNSSTADNLADVADTAHALPGLAGQFAVSPAWALRSLAGRVADAAINGVTGKNEATRKAIADALTSQNAASLLAPLFELQSRVARGLSGAGLAAALIANRTADVRR